MQKEAAIKIITECAKAYRENLLNKNLLFLYGAPSKPEYFETSFQAGNFLHLTGVKSSNGRPLQPKNFYDRSISGQLSPSDFTMSQDGTTETKLSILPQLMQIHCHAKMVGNYDHSRPILYTEKLTGGASGCLGFKQKGKYYFPNTALREDIRDISVHPTKRVLAIFKKDVTEELYTTLCYTAKKLDISSIKLPDSLKQKLDPQVFVALERAKAETQTQELEIGKTYKFKPHEGPEITGIVKEITNDEHKNSVIVTLQCGCMSIPIPAEKGTFTLVEPVQKKTQARTKQKDLGR